MGKNQGAKKGTVVHLAHLVADNKGHIPDRPQERAPDDQGFFRRDFRGYGSDRPQGDRPTFRSKFAQSRRMRQSASMRIRGHPNEKQRLQNNEYQFK